MKETSSFSINIIKEINDNRQNIIKSANMNRTQYLKNRVTKKINNNCKEQKQKCVTQVPIQRIRTQNPKPILQIKNFSYLTPKNPNTNTNPRINNNNIWLNKFFIYRHASLDKYISSIEFKNTLDKLYENYQKQILTYRRLKPPSNTNDKNNISNINFQSNNIKENRNTISYMNSNLNKNNLEKTLPKKKTFIVTGGYVDVVNNLTARGWVKEPNPKCLEFDYIWTLKTNEINFMLLKNYQLCNHYFKNGQITRKSGLCKNIKNLYLKNIDPMNFFPRCYDLSIKIELEDFKQDFKFTWAISLLKLLQKEAYEISRISKFSRKFNRNVIATAVNIVERNVYLIMNKGQFLKNFKDLEKNNDKKYLITDEEWNIIYLPELTQNSDVKDIIYEVNINKPKGKNNQIKVVNKTVPKKLINKENETKKMLVSIQSAQVGSNDTFQFSPNLKSITGLKSKIMQMNNEEKKNNINIIVNKSQGLQNNNSTINYKSVNNRNVNSATIKDGACFQEFIPKISKILLDLQIHLPQYKLNGFRNIWIMKPSNLSRGRGVTCVDSLLPIEQSLSATNDSGLIVQKYIENPLIIYRRKFDIRQWVLVTSLNPLIIWMWKEPYIRFGAEDYKMDDLNNIYSHLTNNSIAKHSLQFKKEKKFEGDMWTCFDFQRYLGEKRWQEIHEKIKNAIICSFFAAHHEIKQRENSHELYGYDFMVDEDLNVYLIEVNASPALDYSTKITEHAVKEMVKDLIELVIDYNNGRGVKVNSNGEALQNKFVQIFNETKDKIKIPDHIPNKSLFY